MAEGGRKKPRHDVGFELLAMSSRLDLLETFPFHFIRRNMPMHDVIVWLRSREPEAIIELWHANTRVLPTDTFTSLNGTDSGFQIQYVDATTRAQHYATDVLRNNFGMFVGNHRTFYNMYTQVLRNGVPQVVNLPLFPEDWNSHLQYETPPWTKDLYLPRDESGYENPFVPIHNTIGFFEFVISTTCFANTAVTAYEDGGYHASKIYTLWAFFENVIQDTHWPRLAGWVGSRLERAMHLSNAAVGPTMQRKYTILRQIFTVADPPIDTLAALARREVEKHKPVWTDETTTIVARIDGIRIGYMDRQFEVLADPRIA